MFQVAAVSEKTTTPAPSPTFRISRRHPEIIDIAFIGPQTAETVEQALVALQATMDEVSRQGKVVNVLVDNALMGHTTIAANQRVMRAVKEIPFHKMAGINANPIIRLVVSAIIGTAGASRRVKLCRNRREAERWLLQP